MPVHNLNALMNFAIEVTANVFLTCFILICFSTSVAKKKGKAPSGEAATALFIGTGLLGEGNS